MAVRGGQNINIWFAEDDEQVGRFRRLEGVGHVQVGIHPGFEDGNATQLFKLGGVGIVVEGAGDDNIKPGIARFTRGRNQIRPRHGTKLRADKDARPLAPYHFPLPGNALRRRGNNQANR